MPFVLHSQPTGVFESATNSVEQMATGASRRYEEIMLDVEQMIDDHSEFTLLIPYHDSVKTRLILEWNLWFDLSLTDIFQLNTRKLAHMDNQN